MGIGHAPPRVPAWALRLNRRSFNWFLAPAVRLKWQRQVFWPRGNDGNFSASGTRSPLGAPRRHQRAFRLIGVNVDEADRHARKGLAALHAYRVGQHAAAVGQMAAVAARKGTDDLDILYGIVVVISHGKGHQRLRAEPAAAPGLRRDF